MTRRILTDALGNVIALTDGDGNVLERYTYDPYGQTHIYAGASYDFTLPFSAYSNPLMWTTQRFDADVELYHFKHPSYSPHLGRWTQRDPAGYVDGMNLYLYGSSNPAGLTDPLELK